jgi:hypothetical protein
MRTGLRKLLLSTHLAVSVGWMGAVAAYLALDMASATAQDTQTLRAVYIGMDLIVRWVVLPLAVASLVTGVAMSLGTRWGLLRHYWVVISLGLTVFATVVLLLETRTIGDYATAAADPTALAAELASLGSTLVHSSGGLVVLVVILVLNVYKPRGMTRYGWRRDGGRSTRDER